LHSLDNIHDRIEAQCQSIVDLEPDEAAEVKPNLDELLENLRTFSDEIAYVQAKVAEILADTEKAQGGGDRPSP
jgi:predicted component of type VI protein secretion system